MAVQPGLAASLAAPAKVNLGLRVLHRREDGFHEIDTVFQAVGLHDSVHLRLARRGVSLHVDGPDLGPVEDNLAFRAAQLFIDEVALDLGVAIRLEKEIPAGGGMGGGSSDAAAVLRLLNRLSGDPLDDRRLGLLGLRLGSDVPFFLGSSPLARGRGRGERLDPLLPLPERWLVLVLPPVHVSTPHAFRALGRSADPPAAGGPAGFSDGDEGAAPLTWETVVASLHNDFEGVVAARHPEVARALDALRASSLQGALLSGSGAVCFGIARDRAQAGALAPRLARELGWPVVAVPTVRRFPAIRSLRRGETTGG